MKFRKQPNTITSFELSEMSKTKTLFIDGDSSNRCPMSKKDAIINRDITGACDYLMAKGHTRRIYGLIGKTGIRKGV